MIRFLALVLALVGPPALAAPELCQQAGEGALRLASPEVPGAVVAQPEPAPLKVGQQFTLSIVLCGEAVGAEVVAVDARMPMHRHGMNYKASVSPGAAEGSYRAGGMLLHMPGLWRVTVDAERNGQRTRYSADVKVMP